jgi:hypothetical protein
VIEEMAGSDRVPDPGDSERATGWKAQTNNESEMALFSECMQECARKMLDSADIVRDRDLSSIETIARYLAAGIASGLPTNR